MAKLVIFGAGDIARLAHHYITTDSEHEVVAFAIDAAYRERDEFQGLPLVDFEQVHRLYPAGQFAFFVGLSYARMNRLRAEKFQRVCELGYEVVSYVSSRCTFLTAEPVGRNCFILEDNTIQPNVRIGDNVTLWSGNHIGHDAVIEDHCFISSHVVVSGHVRVGRFSFLGVNATLRNSITVGPRTLVGAGAVIMADTEEGSVYVPARAQRLPGKTSDDVPL
jgi:sugar O-acyltransferase (sialic acid O-acetyltransferase NeuD family)